ncbi:hypothetical protein A1O7_09588 [Cladophialophora yegresii CBS 114405]|uniref:RRM domain-containing protein n=1 Tax=Cladophialophora yegresii CBS 114405 TaxID=1182544 RepID=W9VQ34_9EURO|nr:uncharacterized protein A1O7_09588 [Cladophialophora yegresii CBS 114405]EXJ54251.1 hypothetical protein A1O7_09588 [Cladophialophora yegresii CBS 114405]
MDSIIKDLRETKLQASDESEKNVQIPSDAANAQPTPTATPIPVVVLASGSPVQNAAGLSADDDVFGAMSRVAATTNVAAAPANAIDIAPTASTSDDSAPNTLAHRILNNLRAPAASHGFAPRPDRVNQIPTAANAQGLFRPDALIFVANLSMRRTEEELEMTVHHAFDAYGPNHVRIHYDRNKHPYAFVQYETAEDANAAVSGAFGMVLDGRKIRIERAKAERAVILSKFDGSNVTEAEARSILARFGPMEIVAPTTTPNRHGTGTSTGIYVRFAYYLDCRDALRLFDNHRNTYRLFIAPSLEPRLHVGPDGRSVVRGFQQPRSAIDQKSIYVGNLPEGTNKAELEQYFSAFGHILNVNVMRKIYDGSIVNNFAFVEFAHQHEAIQAAAGERHFHGVKLRVEAKEYSARHQARVLPVGVAANVAAIENGRMANVMDNSNVRYSNNVRGPYRHVEPAVGVYDRQNHITPPANAMYGTPMQQAVRPDFGIMTPPSQHGMQMPLNQMLPTGIFSPTPSHLADGQYAYQGLPFGAAPAGPAIYYPQSVPTIQETGEETQYEGYGGV